MKWKAIWMTLFGTTEWMGLNIGFWVSMAAVVLIVIVMNLVFWGMKPLEGENAHQILFLKDNRDGTAECTGNDAGSADTPPCA